MALSAGARLGPYEVTAQIGVGGMGEVYRAVDTNLGRQVAVKVLPDVFASDPERLARFEREARTLASLNHSNIAQIYGLEKAGGIHALVMEFVDGPTLEDRIAQGPIPIDEAVSIAKQMADALEAAHEQGIIHRDLKPANVKVRHDGTIKVLDFGLAKMLDGPPKGGHYEERGGHYEERSVRLQPDVTMSPTITSPALMTGVGVLLGTAAYMSPEQAHGRSADRRSDIFSFGAVLYEMLSGRRAFTGDSVSDTLASVLKIEPDWSALPSHVPPSISHVLRRCLMKDRRQRLQSIGEARIVFENPVEQAVSVSAGQPWWWIAATALLATIAGVALWGWLGTTPPESPPSSHFAVALPPAGLPRPRIAISPDGSRVAYPTIRGIYLRAMDRPEPQLLPNTQTATGPIAFSPDGQSLVFVTGQGGTSVLKRISFNDGRAEDLVGVHADSIIRVLDGLLHWGLDDHVYFADGNGLRRVSAHGASEPEIVLPASAGLYFPVHLLRDRNVLLIAGFSAAVDSIGIDALDLQTRQKSSVLSGLARAGGFGAATYVTATGPKQGHIVYGTAESVHAVPFDEERLQASGPAVAIPDVSLPLSVSAQGALVYVQGADAEGGTRQLAWVNTQGVEVPIPGPPRAYSPPLRLSPQGDTLAVSIAGDLWTIDLLAGRAVQITTEEFTGNPVWSRDGKKLFYTTGTRPSLDRRAIAWVSADRSTQPVTLTSDDGVYVTSDVAQGGAILARRENPKNPGAGGQYLSFPISPDGTRLGEGKPFLASRSRLQNLRISPSGEFVAYQALESGRTEVEVAPYPGPGGIVRISTDEGGAAPQWSEDGRQLFYVSNGNKLMVVDVLKSSLEFVASAPKMVLENFRPPYAVARGRFLKFQLPGANQPDELHIVTNWVDTLRRLAPAK